MWLQSIREAFLGRNPFLFCPLQTPQNLSITEGPFPKQRQSLQFKSHNIESKTLKSQSPRIVFYKQFLPPSQMWICLMSTLPPHCYSAHKVASRVEGGKWTMREQYQGGRSRWKQRLPISTPAFPGSWYVFSSTTGPRDISLPQEVHSRVEEKWAQRGKLICYHTTQWVSCETRKRHSSSCIYILSQCTVSSWIDIPTCLLCIENSIYCSRMADVFKQPHFLLKWVLYFKARDRLKTEGI